MIIYKIRYGEQARGSTNDQPVARIPSESGDEGTHTSQASDTTDIESEMSREGEGAPPTPLNSSSFATTTQNDEDLPKPRRPAKGSEPFEKWERDEMEKLLGQLNGQLGMWPVFLQV